MATATKLAYTLGELSRMWGIALQTVRRIYTRGKLPEPRRIGRNRIVMPQELLALRARANALKSPQSNIPDDLFEELDVQGSGVPLGRDAALARILLQQA